MSEENFRFQFLNMTSYNSLYEVISNKEGKPYDFRFIMVNKAYEEYVGKKSSELIGKTLLEVYPSTEQLWIDKMAESVLTGLPIHFDNFSKIMNTHTEINLFIPKKGQLAMTTGNMAERKLAESKLIDSETKFRKLLELVPLPLCYVNEKEEMIFRNKRFLNVLGYDNDDVPTLSKWWEKAYPDEQYRKWVIQNWEKALKTATETGMDIESDEYKVTCKDGSTRQIIISGITIDKDFLVTFFDITEPKKQKKKKNCNTNN